MDFTLTDDQQLLRETARKLLDKECPPALVRAHIDDPDAYRPLWEHLREYAALGARTDHRRVPVPRGDGPRRSARSFLRDGGAVRTAHRRRRNGNGRDRGHEWRLDRERRPGEAVRARSRPRRTHRDHRCGPDARRSSTRRTRALRFVATVDFSRRIFELDTDAVALEPAAAPSENARRVARPRLRLDSRPRWSAPRAGSSRWRSSTPRNATSSSVPIGSLPGDPAQARGDVPRARARDRGRALRRDERRRRRRRTAPRRATSPRPRPAKRRAASSRTASRSTAASATRGSTTSTCTSAARPRTSICSAPPAGTSTASPTWLSTANASRRRSAPVRPVRPGAPSQSPQTRSTVKPASADR